MSAQDLREKKNRKNLSQVIWVNVQKRSIWGEPKGYKWCTQVLPDTASAQFYIPSASFHSLYMAVVTSSGLLLSRYNQKSAHPSPVLYASPFLPWGFTDTEVWGPTETIRNSDIHQCQEVWKHLHSARQDLTSGVQEPRDKSFLFPSWYTSIL